MIVLSAFPRRTRSPMSVAAQARHRLEVVVVLEESLRPGDHQRLRHGGGAARSLANLAVERVRPVDLQSRQRRVRAVDGDPSAHQCDLSREGPDRDRVTRTAAVAQPDQRGDAPGRCRPAGSRSARDAGLDPVARPTETVARGCRGRCCRSPRETRNAGTAACGAARPALCLHPGHSLPLRKQAPSSRSRALGIHVSLPCRLVSLHTSPCACPEGRFVQEPRTVFVTEPRKYDEPVKLVAFTDYVYSQKGEILYGERAFALFLVSLTAHVEQLTIVGRLNREPDTFHYPLPASVRFVGLPHYASLTKPFSVRAIAGSLAATVLAGARRRRPGVVVGPVSACSRVRGDHLDAP